MHGWAHCACDATPVGLVATTRKSTSSRPGADLVVDHDAVLQPRPEPDATAVGGRLDPLGLVGDDRLLPVAIAWNRAGKGLDVQDLDRAAGQVRAPDRQDLLVPGQGQRPTALAPIGAGRSDRPEAQADQDRRSRSTRPRTSSPSSSPSRCDLQRSPARHSPGRLHRAEAPEQPRFHPAQQRLDPSRDGQADRDADQVRDGVIESPSRPIAGSIWTSSVIDRQGQAAQRDPGISPPRGAGPEPEDREDDEDPPVDDLVQVGDLKPGRVLLDLLDDDTRASSTGPGSRGSRARPVANRTIIDGHRGRRGRGAPRPRHCPGSS